MKYFLGCCCLMLLHNSGFGQSGFYISSGTSFYISPNNEVAIDQLGLKPSIAFTVNGTNNVSRSTSIVHPANNSYISRVFQFGSTTNSFSGDITIFYEDAELNGIPENALTLNVYNGTRWMPIPANVTRDGVANWVTTAAISNLGLNELTLAHMLVPLPVQWGTVTALRQADGVEINWMTYNEVNTASFQVERSLDGAQWQSVGHLVRAANTPGDHFYKLTDASVSAAKTFYRIKQVDLNGKYSYSKVVSVGALSTAVQVSLYPNPVINMLHIQTEQLPLVEVRLYKVHGSLIKRETVSHNLSHQIDLSTLPAGFYQVQLQFENGKMFSYPILKK